MVLAIPVVGEGSSSTYFERRSLSTSRRSDGSSRGRSGRGGFAATLAITQELAVGGTGAVELGPKAQLEPEAEGGEENPILFF